VLIARGEPTTSMKEDVGICSLRYLPEIFLPSSHPVLLSLNPPVPPSPRSR